MVFNTLQSTPPPNRPRNATKPTTKPRGNSHRETIRATGAKCGKKHNTKIQGWGCCLFGQMKYCLSLWSLFTFAQSLRKTNCKPRPPSPSGRGALFSLSPQGFAPVPVVPVVVPEAVGGLYGKLAQYSAIACAIFRLVSSLRCLPEFAAAILSLCVCGISLRQILFAIVFIFDIVIIARIGFIINIVQIGKIQQAAKICASNCLRPIPSGSGRDLCSR